MRFIQKIIKWLGYIFEFMHSPFTVISKEMDGKVDYSTDDREEPTKDDS